MINVDTLVQTQVLYAVLGALIKLGIGGYKIGYRNGVFRKGQPQAILFCLQLQIDEQCTLAVLIANGGEVSLSVVRNHGEGPQTVFMCFSTVEKPTEVNYEIGGSGIWIPYILEILVALKVENLGEVEALRTELV